MSKVFITSGLTLLFAAMTASAPAPVSTTATRSSLPLVTVYKDPSCGCCKAWVAYLKQHGFRVDARDTDKLQEIKTNLGVPAALAGCHTAVVNGYVIEGHVPAEDIARLLRERPKIAGLAVPGMPAGSPGMEGPISAHYRVIAFDHGGKTKVFANH